MHYCLPDDPAFSELIRQNLTRKHEAIKGCPPSDDALTLRFDENYIKKRQGRVTRLIDYKGIKVRWCVMSIAMSLEVVELMQIGYECGFGDKNSAGFGMVEV